MNAYQIGREAFREGRLLSTCPYHTRPSILDWKAGWYYEQRSDELLPKEAVTVFTVPAM